MVKKKKKLLMFRISDWFLSVYFKNKLIAYLFVWFPISMAFYLICIAVIFWWAFCFNVGLINNNYLVIVLNISSIALLVIIFAPTIYLGFFLFFEDLAAFYICVISFGNWCDVRPLSKYLRTKMRY